MPHGMLVAAILVPAILIVLAIVVVASARRRKQLRGVAWRGRRQQRLQGAADVTVAPAPTATRTSQVAARMKTWVLLFAKAFDYRHQTLASEADRQAQGHDRRRGQDGRRSGEGNAATGARRQRRRRRGGRYNAVQRSDSGATVRTLPEYNQALGESEMMLFKAELPPSVYSAMSVVQHPDQRQEQHQVASMTEGPDLPRARSPTVRNGSRTELVTVDLHSRDNNDEDDDGGDNNSGDELDEESSSGGSTPSAMSGRRSADGDIGGQDLNALPQTAFSADEQLLRHASITSMAASGISALRRSLRRSANQAGSEQPDVEAVPEEDAPTYDSIYPMLQQPAAPSPLQQGLQPEHQVHLEMQQQQRRQTRAPNRALRYLPWASRNDGVPALASQHTLAHNEQRHRRFSSAASILSSVPGSSSSGRSSMHLLPLHSHNGASADTSQTRLATPPRQSGLCRGSGPLASLPGLSGSAVTDNSLSLQPTSSNGTLDSSHQRTVSAPLSIRRMQYAAPTSGFTDQQMTFLASVESLDRYGMYLPEQLRCGGGGGDVSQSSLPMSANDISLPSFEEATRESGEQPQSSSSSPPSRQSDAPERGTSIRRAAPVLSAGELHLPQEGPQSLAGRTSEAATAPTIAAAPAEADSVEQ